MQMKLNSKFDLIQNERDEWESEKEEIRSKVAWDSEVVKINVGGTTHLHTEKEVLQSVKGSTLQKLFSDMHELKKVEDEVFLDRDGKTFETLINYLRNNRKVFPEFTDKNSENHFYKELHYWGIDKEHRKWQEDYLRKLDRTVTDHQGPPQHMRQSLETHFQKQSPPHRTSALSPGRGMASMSKKYFDPKDYVEAEPEQVDYLNNSASHRQYRDQQVDQALETSGMDDETPGVALKAVKEKWSELGPLRLEDIMQNTSDPIDQKMKFGQSEYNKYIIGQIGRDGRVQGVGKEINHIIYEGQFVNDIYHGYGRYIYSNGNY